MTKKEARKISRENLKNIVFEKKIVASVKINELLKCELTRLKPERLCIFLNDNFEPNTIDLIEKLLSQGIEVSVPILKDGLMFASKISDINNLIENKFGILEPIDFDERSEFDVVIVPLLAFDDKLNRCGRGKGYYDRFLSDKNVHKIGIAFECQRINGFRAGKYDIKMDRIITEEKIYVNNKGDKSK